MEEETDSSEKLRARIGRSERENRFLRKDSDQRKVMEEVFDRSTLLAVEELAQRRRIEDLHGVVAAGKEARVYYGTAPGGSPRAVKIYLTSSAEFRKRLKYIAGDRRFARVPSASREIINLWVQKEFRNLETAAAAGIRVPRPYAFLKNILVMEYIGKPPEPAPTFAGVDVTDEDAAWTFEAVDALYKKAGLIHADLSEYNIFKNGDELVMFDFGSAVLTSHPQAAEFLRRDITNMVRFFRKRGLVVEDAEKRLESLIT